MLVAAAVVLLHILPHYAPTFRTEPKYLSSKRLYDAPDPEPQSLCQLLALSVHFFFLDLHRIMMISLPFIFPLSAR